MVQARHHEPRALDGRPHVSAPSELLSVLDRRSKAYRKALEQSVYRALPWGEPRLDDMAKDLMIGPRSLERRLSAEGTTFSGVLDGLRRASPSSTSTIPSSICCRSPGFSATKASRRSVMPSGGGRAYLQPAPVFTRWNWKSDARSQLPPEPWSVRAVGQSVDGSPDLPFRMPFEEPSWLASHFLLNRPILLRVRRGGGGGAPVKPSAAIFWDLGSDRKLRRRRIMAVRCRKATGPIFGCVKSPRNSNCRCRAKTIEIDL